MKSHNLKLKNVFRFLFVAFIFSFLIFNLKAKVNAKNNSVVINEIAWMGGATSTSDEWIELYNIAEQEIDISGWRIENAGAKNETVVISSGKIAPNGYFLICKTEIGGCDLINSKLSLHNEYNKNGRLALKNGSGSILDATPDADPLTNSGQAWPGGDNKTKQTMERKSPLVSGADIGNWQTSQVPGGTAKHPNSKPPESSSLTISAPLASSSSSSSSPLIESSGSNRSDRYGLNQRQEPEAEEKNIFINEILASPEGSDAENEWIELYNVNNFEVDISEWKVQDKIGATKIYTFPGNTRIETHGFLILKRPQTKISLNNEGDGLELLNPNGKIIDSVDFEKAKQGQSWSKTEINWPAESPAGNQAGWQWTAKPTPGAVNIIVKITTQTTAKTLPTSSQNEKPLLAQVNSAAPKNKNILAVIIAALLAAGSAVVAWQIKKKSTEI